MDIRYQFFEKEKMFIQKFSGTFSFEQYMQFARTIIHHPKSKFVEQVLIDFRHIQFEEDPDASLGDLDKVIEIRKHINASEPQIRNLYHVFWVDKPIPTVIAQLFKSGFPEMKYQYCSTEEEVANLLSLPKHLKSLDVIVRELVSFKNPGK